MITDQALFIYFVASIFAAVVTITNRYLGGRTAVALTLGLSLWFLYVGMLSHFGVLQRSDARPPGMAFILAPLNLSLFIATYLILFRHFRWSVAFPLWLLIATQSFRILVELFIHHLWARGIVPETLTFDGANVDLYVGISALPIGWLSKRGNPGRMVALVWNLLGLLALANVVTRAILTAPGPLNFITTQPPNRMFITFPYMFIPAFFVPLAVTLHLLAIRKIMTCLQEGKSNRASSNLC